MSKFDEPKRPKGLSDSKEDSEDLQHFLSALASHLKFEKVRLPREITKIIQLPTFVSGEQIDFVHLDAGALHPPHVHVESSARLYVISGEGQIILGSETLDYSSGKVFQVPKGTPHGFRVGTETIILSVQDRPIKTDAGIDFQYEEENGS